MHHRVPPSQRVSRSHPGSQRGQRQCGLGSQPREARPELKLCSWIWLALLLPPKEAFCPLLNSFLNLYLASIFVFLPGKALAYVKTSSLFPVMLGVIKYMKTLTTNLALLTPMNHHGNKTLFFIPPLPNCQNISSIYSPGFLMHGQPVALSSPAPHHCEQRWASSHPPLLRYYFL